MAVLDPTTNEIVIRVVYDGPPEAGKTTSLRSLARSLAQTTMTPEEDAAGRTLWFDWMEYVGGRFEGSQIRCQIVSVPGQRSLTARRKRLLDAADVVVSVFDSTVDGVGRSADYLRDLRRMIALVDGPPVGVVLQANKRDLADAVSLDELRAAVGGGPIAIVESVAADGTGIREAFVYAVRLALDRVRELMGQGALAVGPPELRSAEQLLATLRGEGHGSNGAAASAVIADAASSIAAALFASVVADDERQAPVPAASLDAGTAPRPPDATVPSGAIWPPVEGRAILYEIAQLGSPLYRLGGGDWVMGLGCGWRIVSARDACYSTLDEGRAALVQWARLHATSSPVISTSRCIVLADSGRGSWRLWQIVRVEESLREVMQQALDSETPELVFLRLCQGGKQLLDAASRVRQAPCALPCTLDTVGVTSGVAVYIGLMPDSPARDRDLDPPTTLLRAQLGPVVQAARIGDRGVALQRVVDRVPRPVVDHDGLMSTMVAMFS